MLETIKLFPLNKLYRILIKKQLKKNSQVITTTWGGGGGVLRQTSIQYFTDFNWELIHFTPS